MSRRTYPSPNTFIPVRPEPVEGRPGVVLFRR